MLSIKAYEALALLAFSAALLISRRLRHDVVGVITALALVALGLVSPLQALSNLSSVAVVVLASAMIIAGVVADSGVLDVLGDRIASRVTSGLLVIVIVLLISLFSSGFVSDVALTFMLMPLIYSVASRVRRPASRYLVLLSYAAILGGRYTIIGTSSNIVLEGLWTQRFGRPLGIFSTLPVGLAAALAGLGVAIALVPLLVRGSAKGTASLEMVGKHEILIEADVEEGSEVVGLNIRQAEEKLGARIRLLRGALSIYSRRTIRAGDKLILSVERDRLPVIMSVKGLRTGLGQGPFYELLVTGSSAVVGNTIYEVNMRLRDVKVVGVATGNSLKSIRSYALAPGDIVLVEGDEKAVAQAADAYRLTPLTTTPVKSLNVRAAASGLLGLSVALAASTAGLNMALSFLAGALLAVIPQPGSLRKVYSYVDWSAIVFIGTYLSMGEALISSGLGSAMSFMASSPLLLMLAGVVLANLVGNVASAIILGPLAISSPHPLTAVIALSMAVSSTFITPFSHPANLVVYSAGGYTPSDFAKAGVPVVLTVIVVTALMLHLF